MRSTRSLLTPGARVVLAPSPGQGLVFGVSRRYRDDGDRTSTRYEGARCRHLWVTPLLITLLVIPIPACRSLGKTPSTVDENGGVRRGVFDGVKAYAELLGLTRHPPRRTCRGLTSDLSRLAASVNPSLTVEAVNCTPSSCSEAYPVPSSQDLFESAPIFRGLAC
jgi:hypothetical protein